MRALAAACRAFRRSDGLLAAAAVAWLALIACALHADHAARRSTREASAAVARRLGLTDLALFTEARYTRHPSQADLFAPFQDHPHALEHFPSGAVVAPPVPALPLALPVASAEAE